MKILVTGCNGQLGNEMQLLAKKNPQHEYFFTDVVIPEGSVAQKLDITNEAEVEAFVEKNKIDCIVNCAAFTAVDKAESNEDLCNLLNNIAPAIWQRRWKNVEGAWYRSALTMCLTARATNL